MVKAKALKQLIKHNKTNFNELAIIMGITRQSLSNYVNNKIDISAKTLFALAYMLHCDINEIYDDESETLLKKGGINSDKLK